MSEVAHNRPKFLDLRVIKQPVPAVASILHRLSGAGMFLLLPLLLWLLQQSLASPATYDQFHAVVAHPLVKLILTGLIWALLHHLCMGVRILLIDLHIGVEKAQARSTAWTVMGISILGTLLAAWSLWGA